MKFASLVSAIALLSGAAAANAADLIPCYGNACPSTKDAASSSANTWTGFYLGGNLGYGWDTAQDISSLKKAQQSLYDAIKSNTKPAGWFAGAQVGGNWQIVPGFLGGVEADVQIANIADDSGVTAASGETTSTGPTHSTVDWFGTARLRAGPTLFNDRLFVYGTGGFAYGGISNRAVIDVYSLKDDAVRFGWVAGGGAEWKISKDWSLKAEYQHIDLGSDHLSDVIGSVTVNTNAVHNSFETVRVGVNYKFTN